MTLSVQDALVYLMVVTASSDEGISDHELAAIGSLVDRPLALRFDLEVKAEKSAEHRPSSGGEQRELTRPPHPLRAGV